MCGESFQEDAPDYSWTNGYLKPEPLTGDDVRPDVVALDPRAAGAHNPTCTAAVPRIVMPDRNCSDLMRIWGDCGGLDGTDCND